MKPESIWRLGMSFLKRKTLRRYLTRSLPHIGVALTEHWPVIHSFKLALDRPRLAVPVWSDAI
jgi:hypothetical protein